MSRNAAAIVGLLLAACLDRPLGPSTESLPTGGVVVVPAECVRRARCGCWDACVLVTADAGLVTREICQGATCWKAADDPACTGGCEPAPPGYDCVLDGADCRAAAW